jgi:hypothetical protein
MDLAANMKGVDPKPLKTTGFDPKPLKNAGLGP